MLDELTPTHLVEFKGWFSRGPDEVCPQDHLETADNLRYFNGGFETRYGTSVAHVALGTDVRRFFPYLIEGQADRVLYLFYSGGVGSIYDTLFPGSPILSIAGMQDFSMVVLNDRAYLSPHNGITGMAGQNVWIYQGAGISARLAGGNPPSGFSMGATNGVGSGRVEAGLHLLAVVYETDSGFITAPGVYTTITATGGHPINLTNVQPGPPGTVARHILSTRIIEPVPVPFINDEQEIFFVEGGSINDNVGTTLVIDFYDSELLRSADYLKDQMSTIPAVLGFTTFAGSLVGWAPNTEPSSVYLSKSGEPESISLIEGGIEVEPTTGGGVRNCVEYRGAVLMIHKAGKLYTTANNGEEPVYWKVDKVDTAVGTSVFGIAAILDEEGNTVDRYVIAAKQGLIVYEGNFENVISTKIDDVWGRITKTAWHKVQVVMDPINEFIACAVPLDGSPTVNALLYCDFAQGLNPSEVRWSKWTFPYTPTAIGIDVALDGSPVFKIAANNGEIYFLDLSAQGDNLVAIPEPTFRTSYVGDGEVAVNYYGGIRLRATGTGALALQFSGLDDVITVNPQSFVLGASPGRLLQRDFNLSSQLGRLKGFTSNYGERFRITKISVYHKPEFFEEPA